MGKIKTRSQVKEKDKWDLSHLFKDERAWERAFLDVKGKIRSIQQFESSLHSRKDIHSCLDLYFSLSLEIQKLHAYAQRRLDENVADGPNNIRMNRINDLVTLFSEKTVFIELALSKKDEKFLNGLIKDKGFKDHSFYIRRIARKKKHLLTDKEEQLLAKLREANEHPYNLFGKINDSDFKFEDIEHKGKKIAVSQSNLSIFLKDKDREVRKKAMNSILQPYHQFRETLSQNLFQHIKNNITLSKIRGFSSALEEFSFEDDLRPQIYNNLFKEVDRSLPLLHRYCELRRRVLGYKSLHWYDLYVPLVQERKDESISYHKAVETVLESLGILGDEYTGMSEIALKGERWVDIYPNTGKRSGAYSSFGYKTPAYILMNYNGTLDAVSTLAHELGHSMHTHYSGIHNSYSASGYPIFLAEIASTFNEEALADHLMAKGDRATKIYIIGQELEKIRLTFFRQAMFAEFEKKLYDTVEAGIMLTADYLEKEYLALNKRYYGKRVEIDELISSEWARIPHFYYNFYVYKYATGLAIANYFYEKVRKGDKGERDNYLKILKAGGSNFPAEILRDSGLDIYDARYLKMLMKKFEKLLSEFEKGIKHK